MSYASIKNTPSMKAVVPFYGTAAISFLVITIMLLFSTDAFDGDYTQAKFLALVHTASLGWGTMIIFGATYQLLPVIFDTELYSDKLAFASFICLLSGTILLVYNFWIYSLGALMQTGAGFILLAIIIYVLNVILTAKKSDKASVQKYFIVISAIWLLITSLIGVLLVTNFTNPVFEQDPTQILKLHAHAGIVGWFLLLIIGVGSKLFPMFLLGKSSKEKLLKITLYLINIGLSAFLIDGYYYGITYRTIIYAAIIIAGIVLFLIYIFDVFRKRLRKKIDYQMRHSLLSMIFLLFAIIHIPVLILKPDELSCVFIYGTLIFMGWITSIILGMTTKTLPFIVWNNVYKDVVGKTSVPMPKQLYFDKWIKWQFIIYLLSMILLIIGIKLNYNWLLKTDAVLLIIVAVMYNINVFKIIFHKSKILKNEN